MTYEYSTDSGIFNFWIENYLLTKIPKHSLVVMDNASFNKSDKTKELVEKNFLPPYSPDLNSIEKFLASLKAKIKKSPTA